MLTHQIMMNIIWAAVGGLLLTAFLVPLVKLLAIRVGAVDQPSARKVHAKAMPRMGGLAIYAAFWISAFLAVPITRSLLGMFLGATMLVFVGIVDDVTDMPPKLKLLGQIISAGLVVASGPRIEFMTNFLDNKMLSLEWLSIPVTVIWIVAIINAVNLIDGLDGLAAGVSAIAAATMAIVSWQNGDVISILLGSILCACCIGFLFYNFNPASVFMGDTGSMFLGYTLAVISTQGASKGITFVSVFIPILVLGVPIFDTLFAIIRRAVAGKPIFEADKAHLHHCLLRYGFSHRNTVLLIYAVSVTLSGCALMINQVTTAQGFLIMIAALTALLVGANRLGIIGKAYLSDEKEQKK